MKYINQPIRKKDAMQLVQGKPLFLDDLARPDSLIVKVLRSPHANALIKEIKTDKALKIPGIEAIFTYQDVSQKRFTMAGQTYPEPSPYDRLILDWSTAANLPAIILLTKADKLGVTARSKALKEVKLLLSEFDGNFTVIPFSAWSGIGIDETRKLLSMWYSSFQPIEENENV